MKWGRCQTQKLSSTEIWKLCEILIHLIAESEKHFSAKWTWSLIVRIQQKYLVDHTECAWLWCDKTVRNRGINLCCIYVVDCKHFTFIVYVCWQSWNVNKQASRQKQHKSSWKTNKYAAEAKQIWLR